MLITYINNIPAFSTKTEAIAWGQINLKIKGAHTHHHTNQAGNKIIVFMSGISHKVLMSIIKERGYTGDKKSMDQQLAQPTLQQNTDVTRRNLTPEQRSATLSTPPPQPTRAAQPTQPPQTPQQAPQQTPPPQQTGGSGY